MAGGKETPRQKMIGMMYLVLTALLALQVNSAILLKFKFIDDSLTDVNGKTEKAADGTVKGIQDAVAKNRNQAADVAVLKKSEEIRGETKKVIDYLNEVRDKLYASTENVKGQTDYKNMSAEDKVAITMLGGNQNGLAYPMQKRLNGYSDYIKQFVPDARPLALDAKNDPRIAANSEQHSKNFAELNF
jgi:gliding motility-associated protein GldM